jgi:hypothetical protein
MSSTDARPPAKATSLALPSAVIAMLFRSLGVLAVLAIPVVSGLGSVDSGAPGADVAQQESSGWKDTYSQRYPGCVPSVLWPAEEKPVALLTRDPDGRVHKITIDVTASPVDALPAGAHTIGVCR